MLRETLKQMTHLERDDSFDWELLVVDNNSTDETPGATVERLPASATKTALPSPASEKFSERTHHTFHHRFRIHEFQRVGSGSNG